MHREPGPCFVSANFQRCKYYWHPYTSILFFVMRFILYIFFWIGFFFFLSLSFARACNEEGYEILTDMVKGTI